MTAQDPMSVVEAWVDGFNRGDVDAVASLYAENAINHQVATAPITGQKAIRDMFARQFASAKQTCLVDNLFQDGEWAILEWRDMLGLRGYGVFLVVEGKIRFARGCWDKLNFLRQHGRPLPVGTAMPCQGPGESFRKPQKDDLPDPGKERTSSRQLARPK